ncbi:hypothetical protein pEaSNUABM11_00209 [Erwinia phage pEa_SNUABM_11]|nr:hypothetical protein pEaSNUABM11_00209 [Erwinia phage pEa_SNUABM_11]
MLQVKSIHDHAKYFLSLMTAYNVDGDALRSMVSTTTKVIELEQAIQHGADNGMIGHLASQISQTWFNHAFRHPLFNKHTASFFYVKRQLNALDIEMQDTPRNFPHDTTTQYMVIADPTASAVEILDLESGERLPAVASFTTNGALSAGKATINHREERVWNSSPDARFL